MNKTQALPLLRDCGPLQTWFVLLYSELTGQCLCDVQHIYIRCNVQRSLCEAKHDKESYWTDTQTDMQIKHISDMYLIFL